MLINFCGTKVVSVSSLIDINEINMQIRDDTAGATTAINYYYSGPLRNLPIFYGDFQSGIFTDHTHFPDVQS